MTPSRGVQAGRFQGSQSADAVINHHVTLLNGSKRGGQFSLEALAHFLEEMAKRAQPKHSLGEADSGVKSSNTIIQYGFAVQQGEALLIAWIKTHLPEKDAHQPIPIVSRFAHQIWATLEALPHYIMSDAMESFLTNAVLCEKFSPQLADNVLNAYHPSLSWDRLAYKEQIDARQIHAETATGQLWHGFFVNRTSGTEQAEISTI